MSRLRAEWLVLPLFLLPVLVGGALALYARASYFAELDDVRRLGRRRVEAWLERSPAEVAYWTERFDAAHRPRETDVPVGGGAFVRLREGHALGVEPWRFTDRYPGSLPAAVVAANETRAVLETGVPASSFEQFDAAGREFARLLRRADLDGLRDAPLPAASKLFLVRRWGGHANAEALLSLVAGFADVDTATPGFHRRGDATAVRAGGRLLIGATPAADYAAPLTDDLHVRFGAGDGVWTGRLEAPLAGDWAIEAVHGEAWWRASAFRRWAGPVAALLLASLLLPVALFVAVRKQRFLDEARTRFITELAHDLRTPLTSVRLHAEMLASGRAPDTQRYAEVMARESARLTSLLANLLDLSRLDRDCRVFERADVSLREAVEASVHDFATLYPERAADVTVEGDEVTVVADPTALGRCLSNLLDNAGKFTPAGARVAVAWRAVNGSVVLRVADTGPGVPDDVQLFRRYSRGARAAKDGVPGTGVGLALVKELAEGMEGSVASVPAENGACFEVSLRRAE